ncbi:MAG: tetratricopeptide repeat protein [Anaerovoracaceae bacterium]
MEQPLDMMDRDDRIAPYLKHLLEALLFDSFSEEYLSRESLEFMVGVPIPIQKEDLSAFLEGGIPLIRLADNMALVTGVDPAFPSAGAYMRFLARFFDENLPNVLADLGAQHLHSADYAKSAAYFRSALVLDSSHQTALFGYACACREWYLSLEAEDSAEQIQALKDEALEFYELCNALYPELAAPYYFLGYAYLNLGMYTKAKLVWEEFLKLESEEEERQEIEERLEQLEDPVRIEEGINFLLAGKLNEGLAILEPYAETETASWWPLHYYLASAYRALGHDTEAIEGFHKVLELAPSHIDSTMQLAELYEQKGDDEKAEKYFRKVHILHQNRED